MSLSRTIAIGGLSVGVALVGGYAVGTVHTENRWKAIVAANDKDHADERANAALALSDEQAKNRQLEGQHRDQLAAVDQSHLKAMQANETISNRTITDLRAGTVRLRAQLAAATYVSTAAAPGTSTGQRDDATATAPGLHDPDAEFLLREATRADALSDQLRACQAVVQADRQVQ